MSDFFCVYTGLEWPEDQRSDEHIVPYALGGSHDLVTRDVSVRGNNTAGHTADASLVNMPFMRNERFTRKLASEDGYVPDFELAGTITGDGFENGVQGRLRISPDGKISTWLKPRVERSGTAFQVECLVEDKERILSDLTKKLARDGHAIDRDKLHYTTRVTEHPRINGGFPIDETWVAMHAGFMKIALAMGHRALGYAWSRGRDAQTFRDYLAAKNDDARERVPMRGSIWPACSFEKTLNGLNLNDMMRVTNDHHVLGVLNYGGLVFYALLFGRYDACIRLSTDDFGIEPQNGVITVIDTKTRKVEERSMQEHVRERPRTWVLGWTPEGVGRLVRM